MGSSRGIELLCELRFLPQKYRKRVLVLFPVLYLLSCYAALDSCTGHGCTHLADKPGVYWLRNEVVTAKTQVVHLVHIVHHIGNRLLGQSGYGQYGGHLHLFIDSGGMHIQCTTEDVWEAYHIVYLVWIVGATSRHQHVGACIHGILIAYFGHRVGQGKDDRVFGHTAHHVLRQHISF